MHQLDTDKNAAPLWRAYSPYFNHIAQAQRSQILHRQLWLFAFFAAFILLVTITMVTLANPALTGHAKGQVAFAIGFLGLLLTLIFFFIDRQQAARITLHQSTLTSLETAFLTQAARHALTSPQAADAPTPDMGESHASDTADTLAPDMGETLSPNIGETPSPNINTPHMTAVDHANAPATTASLMQNKTMTRLITALYAVYLLTFSFLIHMGIKYYT